MSAHRMLSVLAAHLRSLEWRAEYLDAVDVVRAIHPDDGRTVAQIGCDDDGALFVASCEPLYAPGIEAAIDHVHNPRGAWL